VYFRWVAGRLGAEVKRLLILVGVFHLVKVKLKLLLLRLRLLDKVELAGRCWLGKVKLSCVQTFCKLFISLRLEIEAELLLSLWFKVESELVLSLRGWSAEKTEKVLLCCWL
jgi:hypothetical protein